MTELRQQAWQDTPGTFSQLTLQAGKHNSKALQHGPGRIPGAPGRPVRNACSSSPLELPKSFPFPAVLGVLHILHRFSAHCFSHPGG